MIRESFNEHASRPAIGRRRSDFRLCLNESYSMNDGIEEFATESPALLLVPQYGGRKFFAGCFEVSIGGARSESAVIRTAQSKISFEASSTNWTPIRTSVSFLFVLFLLFVGRPLHTPLNSVPRFLLEVPKMHRHIPRLEGGISLWSYRR